MAERGQALVESAVIIPTLIIVLVFGIDLMQIATTRARCESIASQVAARAAYELPSDPHGGGESLESRIGSIVSNREGLPDGYFVEWETKSNASDLDGAYTYHVGSGAKLRKQVSTHAAILKNFKVTKEIALALPASDLFEALTGGAVGDTSTISSSSYSVIVDLTDYTNMGD